MSLEGKTEDEIKLLEQSLIDRLEEKGGVAGNITLLRTLTWDEPLYWSVRDRLVDAGQLVLGKGKGGSVRLVKARDSQAFSSTVEIDGGRSPALVEIPGEEALYEPAARVLRDHWIKDNRFRESVVEITAKQGKRETGGKWSRPDITVVSMSAYAYVPGRHFDVATFELKTVDGLDVTAVYEALAHRRAATRAYVVVHAPENRQQTSTMADLLTQVGDEAKRHGVGFIVMGDPGEYASWDERVEAIRIDPAPERLNDFIAVQLSDGAKEEIVQWFK